MTADVGVITVSGVNPSSPTNHGTFAASKSSSTASMSVTITSNPGDLTASVGDTSDSWVSPYTNQTLKWGIDSGAAGGDVGPGIGTTTHKWTDAYAGQSLAVSGANFSAVGSPDFSLSASPSSQTVIQGNPTTYNLTITPNNGFSGQITLSVSGLPTGANGTFSPNPSTSNSSLSVTTATSTPAGTYSLTITGISGSLTHTTTATLVVTAPDFSLSSSPITQTVLQGSPTSYNLTINPTNGFADQVTFSVSGLPTGAGGTFTPNPATGSSSLSVTTSSTTPAGSYPLTITGISGSLTHTTPVTLVVTAPDFSLGASPLSQTIPQGNSTSYNVTITPTNGFAGQVTFSVSGLPTGAGGTFTPNPATGSSSLSVTTSSTTPTGTYPVTITGISGSLTHTTPVTLVVTAPDFGLGASPSSQTIPQGNSTSYNVTITPTNGFAGQVTFSVSGLPTGAGGSFSPNPATSTSALSVTTSMSTPTGTYTVTVTGVSGSLTHTTTVTLVVTAAPDFTLTASPSSQTVVPGGSTTFGVTIGATNGFAGQVTLGVSGLPTGANGTFSPNPATGSSTLSLTSTASTATGTYPLTITGTSGTLTHTATVTLVVSLTAPSTVTFDNKISSKFYFGVASVTTPVFTIGAGSNRAAMIMVVMTSNTATSVTASLGGVPATLIPGTDSGTTASGRCMIFQVINPPSGSQKATVSWTGSVTADVGVITVSGADQTNPTKNGTFSASSSSPAKTTSVTITSNPGDLTASVGYTSNSWVTPYTNETLRWGVDSKAAGGDSGLGTGTTTHTWTDAYAGQVHAVSGASFKAAGTP